MAPCRATLTTGPRITVAPGDGGGAPRREAARKQQRKLTGKVLHCCTVLRSSKGASFIPSMKKGQWLGQHSASHAFGVRVHTAVS